MGVAGKVCRCFVSGCFVMICGLYMGLASRVCQCYVNFIGWEVCTGLAGKVCCVNFIGWELYTWYVDVV